MDETRGGVAVGASLARGRRDQCCVVKDAVDGPYIGGAGQLGLDPALVPRFFKNQAEQAGESGFIGVL